MVRKITVAIFLLFPQIISGKSRHFPSFPSNGLSVLTNRKETAKALEERFRPILEHKASRTKRSRGFSSNLQPIPFPSTASPSDKDFLLLIQLWDDLSPEFVSLYRAAATIPESFITVASAGGHFDISYSLSGVNAVDSTDNYGYSSVDWRIREQQSNGIPDYIDEVGWALDSCWTVQVDKFGLAAPTSYLKNGTSERYGVIVEKQDPIIYGVTWVGERLKNSTNGYSSYISLRNTWPTLHWGDQGYDKHPESGVRVTCAHEFFHAIQYAMSWNVVSTIYLDNFPLSWIEGSATAMEEFLFKDINDYILYANMYFSNPGPNMSFLNGNNDVYTNSILMLYLLKRTSHIKENNFITLVHKNNFSGSMDFTHNISTTSKTFGYDWTTLLNDFHTASFFTGYMADTNRFISDASHFGHWSFQEDSNLRGGSLKKINPYAMESFYIKKVDSDIDTLWIFFQNETEILKSSIEKPWAASIIISKIDGDTVIPVQLNTNGNGLYQFTGWKSADYALAIVSNGNPEQILPFSVWFEYSDVTYSAESTYVIHPNHKTNASITLRTKTGLRGSLQIIEANDPDKYAFAKSINNMANVYDITIPGSWKNDFYRKHFSITFSLRIPIDYFSANSSDSSIYYYDPGSSSWKKMSTHFSHSSDWVELSTEIIESGIYSTNPPAGKASLKIPGKVLVYPNRVRHLKTDSIYICGAEVSQIRVYGLDGTIKYEGSPTRNRDLITISNQNFKYSWLIPKDNFNPGLYSMIIRYTDDSGKRKSSLQKIIVTP